MKKSYTLTILSLFFVLNVFSQTWNQVGATITGDAASGDNLGHEVSMSEDGTVLATGLPGASNLRGTVVVYQKSGLDWVMKGDSIPGESGGDSFGSSVALDSAGNTIVIGAPTSDAGFTQFSNSGRVQVYSWNGSAWVQKGANIDALAEQNGNGESVSISADGNRIAIGASGAGGGGTARGHVRVFEWSGSAWNQIGSTLTGTADFDLFGTSVSLNNGGDTLAVGAINHSATGTSAGQVQIFAFDGVSSWSQVGSDLNGNGAGDIFGNSVSLSASGNSVAIGAPGDLFTTTEFYGYFTVYDLIGGVWTLRGDSVLSTINGDEFGISVSLSKDGNYIAVGTQNNTAGNEKGRAHVYNWSGSSWVQVGDTLKGSTDFETYGASVFLAEDGKTVAIGAPTADNGGGRVDVFNYGTCATSSSISPVTCNSYTSPSGKVWTTTGTYMDTIPNAALCDSIITINLTVNNSTSSTISPTACDSYTSPSGKIFTSTNTYMDTIPNAALCDSVITINLTINITPSVDLGADVNTCDSIMLDAGNAGATYSWSSNATTQTIYATSSGSYIVEVTRNGCSNKDTINVTINSTLIELGNDTSICPEDNITLSTAISGATYSWNTGETTQSITTDTAGTYTLKVTKNGCSNEDTIVVSEYSSPMVDLGNDTAQCEGTVTLDASEVTGTYSWNHGLTTSSITTDTTGLFWVKATDGNGCLDQDTVFVNIVDSPNVDLGKDITVCSNTILLSDTTAQNHTWNNGSESPGIIVNTAGEYYVEASNENFCFDSDTVVITVEAPPAKTLPSTIKVCNATPTLDPGIGDSFKWNTGETTQAIVANTSGKYLVEITSGTCVFKDSVQVTIDTVIAVILGDNEDVCGKEVFNAQYDYANYTWSTGETTKTIEIEESGTYSVIVSQNGCSDTDTVVVNIKSRPEVDFGNDTIHCGVAILDAGTPGLEYLWSNGETTQSITTLPGTINSVEVTNSGCSSKDSIRIAMWGQKGTDLPKTSRIQSITMPDESNLVIANSSANTDKGEVKVYTFKGGDWIQRGSTLEGIDKHVDFGWEVSMPDSNTLAVNTLMSIYTARGIRNYINIYDWNGSDWEEKRDFKTSSQGTLSNFLGMSMGDANHIAVGVRQPSEQYGEDYTIHVYKWNGSTWSQKGTNLPLFVNYRNNFSIDMVDSNNVAVTVYNHDRDDYTRVMTWNGTKWIQKGNDLNYAKNREQRQKSSMPDANTIVVAKTQGFYSSNYMAGARVYEWDGTAWVQKGSDLTKECNESYGSSVSMPNSNTLIVGSSRSQGVKSSYGYGCNYSSNGEIDVFEWDGADWKKKGFTQLGKGSLEQIGGTVYMPATKTFCHTVYSTTGYSARVFAREECSDTLILNRTITGTDTQTACGSYTWIDGVTYTSSNNTATHTLTAANGGDSIVTLDLTILSPSTGTDVQTACGSFTWIDGVTYTSSNNTATDTLTGVNGCDSVVTLNLTIYELESRFTQSADTSDGFSLTIVNKSIGHTLSYLWKFGDGDSATGVAPEHTYPDTGHYNLCLTVTDINNCSDTFCDDIHLLSTKPAKTEGIPVSINVIDSTTNIAVSVEPIMVEENYNIKVYPNPNTGQFIIETEQPGSLTIVNTLGAVIYREDLTIGSHPVNIEDKLPGMYLIIMKGDNWSTSYRMIISQ